MRPGFRRTQRERLCAFVARAGDRGLERVFGSPAALRLLFRAAELAYVPAAAEGFTGELAFELCTDDGIRPWTLAITPEHARARRGAATTPALTLQLSLADFVRIAAGVLDADEALLTGRLDLIGDLALAMRLPALFGR